jgi:hypothetical protein
MLKAKFSEYRQRVRPDKKESSKSGEAPWDAETRSAFDRLALSSYVEVVVPLDVELVPELVPLLDMLGQLPEVLEDID